MTIANWYNSPPFEGRGKGGVTIEPQARRSELDGSRYGMGARPISSFNLCKSTWDAVAPGVGVRRARREFHGDELQGHPGYRGQAGGCGALLRPVSARRAGGLAQEG